MDRQLVFGACILMITTLARSAGPTADFRIEVLVHNRTSKPITVPVECPRGCDWDVANIECPGGNNDCSVMLDGRTGVQPLSVKPIETRAEPDILRPYSGTVCIGMAPAPPDEVPPGAKHMMVQVRPDGPAGLAGIGYGDVLLSLNGVPVQDLDTLIAIVHAGVAGGPFEATLTRNGKPIQAHGQFGVLTNTRGCMVATPELLATPPAVRPTTSPSPIPFEISFAHIDGELRCFEGCSWSSLPAPCPPTQRCSLGIREGGTPGAATPRRQTAELARAKI
jgi:hypothetical protein